MNIRDKILLIEDERTIRSFMQAILTANGYDVLMAGTGAMANTMIASHCPDLIILDLGLPDMDGMTILRSVRQWSKVPIHGRLRPQPRARQGRRARRGRGRLSDKALRHRGAARAHPRGRPPHPDAGRRARPSANTGVFTAGELTIDYDKHRVYIAGRRRQSHAERI